MRALPFFSTSGWTMAATSLTSLADLERLQEEVHAAGLDLGEVEDVVDQPQQVLAGRVHPLQVRDRNASSPRSSASSWSISEYPMMALSGVRNSWLMFARNCDLCLTRLCELAVLLLELVRRGGRSRWRSRPGRRTSRPASIARGSGTSTDVACDARMSAPNGRVLARGVARRAVVRCEAGARLRRADRGHCRIVQDVRRSE